MHNLKLIHLTLFQCSEQWFQRIYNVVPPTPPSPLELSSSCETETVLLLFNNNRPPQPLAPTVLPSVSVNLMTLSTSCRWDHTVLVLW